MHDQVSTYCFVALQSDEDFRSHGPECKWEICAISVRPEASAMRVDEVNVAAPDCTLQDNTAAGNSEEQQDGCGVGGRDVEGEGPADREDTDRDGVPYDRGWAWAVALGCFIHTAIFAGYIKSFSLFYVELLHRFNASAAHTAFFFSITNAVLGIGSLIIMNIVVGRLGVRKTVLIGGLLLSLSGILPSLSNDMMTIIWLQGVCVGLGQAMIESPGQVLLGSYFRRKRALAMSLMKCGGSVGGMVMPFLVALFLQAYALSGALLLTGGLCLHVIPAALLLRPLSSFIKHKSKREASKRTTDNDQQVDKDLDSTQGLMKKDAKIKDQDSTSIKSAFRASRFLELPSSEMDTAVRNKQCSLSELSEQSKKGVSAVEQEWSVSVSSLQDSTTDSLADVAMMGWNSASSLQDSDHHSEHTAKHNSTGDETTDSHCPTERTRSTRCPKASSFMLDFSLFRRPLFCLLMGYFVVFDSINTMISYLPALASEHGVTDYQNGVLLSIMGALDLVSRILCAIIGHSKLLRVTTMIILSYVIMGVAIQFVRFLTSFSHFVALSALLGLLGGVCNTTLPLVVLEFVGLDDMAKTLGFAMMTLCVSAAASFPALGYIRDLTGSYVPVYHVIGVGAILAAGLLGCEKCVRRLENSMKRDPQV